MDVEIKEPPLANGTDGEDNIKNKTEEKIEKSPNDPTKPFTRQKHKRSRSTTPTSKADDCKDFQITLTKLDEEQNGRDENKEEKETIEPKSEANGETENNTPEDEPITKRTRHQKELAAQHERVTSKEDKEEKERTPQKTLSPKKVCSPDKNTSKTEESLKKDASKNEGESDSMEMEPLVISDEQEPELQFDELSDKESGKGSPVIPRCITRRSLTRNIPTPKTPKSFDEEIESEQASTTTEPIENEQLPKNDIDDTLESTDSTKAEVGSDETRLEYVDKNITLPVDDTYLNEYREKSLTETIRCLSARRPIRDTYRNRTFRIQEKSDLDAPFHNRDSVELTSSGIKRRNRSITPEETKKFKSDTSSFFTSPLPNLRGKFRSDTVASSTPLLRGYRDSRTDLHFEDNQGHTVENGLDDKKSWCLLM